MSPQQRDAVNLILTTNDNLIIDAVAGAGKTTTTLQLAAAVPHQKFIVMVYNHRLMEETNKKVRDTGMSNVSAFNYHSLGKRYYAPDCFTDNGLKRVVQDDLPAFKKLPDCDFLVLDEQQDMTPLLYLFICKFIRDVSAIREAAGKTPYIRLVLMGDPKQELYGFNDADSRFLTMGNSEVLFGRLAPPGSEWHHLSHTTSYRMTADMVNFINHQVLKPLPGQELRSGQDSDLTNLQPRYLFGDAFRDPLQEISYMLNSGLRRNEILILAASTKSVGTPVVILANKLSDLGFPIFVASSNDDMKATQKAHRGKILISTYHQAKGIERDGVFVYNFDGSYNKYYNRSPVSLFVAENAMYVALTRAKKHLAVFHHYEMSCLPFLDLKRLGSTCKLEFMKDGELKHDENYAEEDEKDKVQRKSPTVTDLLSHLPERVISQCIALLKGKEVSQKCDRPGPVTEVETGKGLWEVVADITGTAIPAIYEWKKKNSCNVFSDVLNQLNLAANKQHAVFRLIRQNSKRYVSKLQEIKLKIKAGNLTEGDILYLANISCAMMSGYIYKVLAIPLDGYTWFTPEHTRDLCSILSGQLGGLRGICLEETLNHKFKFLPIDETLNEVEITVAGRLDACRMKGKRALWELKFTNTPRAEHYLQVALYAAIMEGNGLGKGDGCYNLVYIPSGQIINIRPKYKGAFMDIAAMILKEKTRTQPAPVMTDEEFLTEAGVGFKNVVGKAIVLPGLGS